MITRKASRHMSEQGSGYELYIEYERDGEVVKIDSMPFNEAGLTAIIKELELIRDSMISIYTEEE